jgi:hypothetical protein
MFCAAAWLLNKTYVRQMLRKAGKVRGPMTNFLRMNSIHESQGSDSACIGEDIRKWMKTILMPPKFFCLVRI